MSQPCYVLSMIEGHALNAKRSTVTRRTRLGNIKIFAQVMSARTIKNADNSGNQYDFCNYAKKTSHPHALSPSYKNQQDGQKLFCAGQYYSLYIYSRTLIKTPQRIPKNFICAVAFYTFLIAVTNNLKVIE